MNTPIPSAPSALRLCERCGGPLNESGVCNRCLFLEFDALELDKFSLSGLEDIEEIARGGMGVVYKAREAATGRIVAVKVPTTHMWSDEEAMRRFAQEVRSAALLDHPHVLPVYEVGRSGDAPFFTMKFAGGGSLDQQAKARRDDPAFFRWTAETMAKIADAVRFAHEHGVLHRDLKPGNILFDEAGEPYVADFGLAKWLEGCALGEASQLTRTITALGTPHYLAPEIAAGRTNAASTSADVYSLGAMLYELLSGQPPHVGSSITVVLRKVADEPVEPPSKVTTRPLPRDLEAICMKALEPECSDRYPTAASFAADLRRFLAGDLVHARPLPVAQQAWRWSRRHPAISVLAATLMLVLAISAVIQVRSARNLANALANAEGSLRDSLIAQSRLVRKSHRLGQRHDALRLVRQAIAAKGGDTLALRNEAAAALASPDMRMVGEAFQFKPTAQRGHCVAVTPDFRFVLCRGVDNLVALRNLDTGANAWTCTPTRGALPDRLHLSDSAQFAALSFSDHSLEVWDTSENKLLLSTQLLPAAGQNAYYTPARPFCLHPTLPLVAGVDEKGTLWLRHLDSGVQETVLENRKNTTAVHLTPAGKHVAIAGGSSVEGWALSPPKREWRISLREAGNATAWDEDGLLIADRASREVVVVKGNRGGTSAFRGHEAPVTTLELAPAGWRAFSLSSDGWLCAWDKRAGRLLWEMQAGISFMKLHRDGRALLIEDRPGRAMKWECAPERVFREFTSPLNASGAAAAAIKVSGDGRLVATVSNAYILLWDTRQGNCVNTWQTQGDVPGTTVAFSPDSSVVCGSRVNGAGIFRRSISWQNNSARFGEPVLVPGSEGKVISHISPDGKSWIVHDAQTLRWQPGSGQPPEPVAPGDMKRGRLVSPLLRYIYPAACGSGTHSVFDVKSGLPCGEFTARNASRCEFSPNEQWLLLRGSSQYQFIDAATWQQRAAWPCSFDAGVTGVAAISSDGKLAALEQKHHVIDIVTLPECLLLVSLEPPVPTTARAMTFSPDGGSLFVLSASHRLFEWDLRALQEELGKLGLAW